MINKFFENHIRNVIVSVFPNLYIDHINILHTYTIRLINLTILMFNIKDYETQFKQNDNRDIKLLISHLLPYLKNAKDIRTFDDIYIRKEQDINLNLDEPKYIHSNIQYNRFIRNSNNYEEKKFDIKDLEQNFYLLIETEKYMSNKMHVNWIDIKPYTFHDYKETELYLNTLNMFTNGKYREFISTEHANLSLTEIQVYENAKDICKCLFVGDIYDVISNDFYHDIKYIKWCIYDINIQGQVYPIIMLLNEILGLESCCQNTLWNELTDEGVNQFNIKWKNFISNAKSKKGEFQLTFIEFQKIVKSLVYAFDRSNIKDMAENYIELKEDQEDEDDEYIEISYDKVLRSLESIETRFAYEFLTESVQKLKNSVYYGAPLMEPDRDKFNIVDLGSSSDITVKNIYNFAKSFVHYVDDSKKFVEYPMTWKSLNKAQKQEIFKRINDNTYQDWFNISKYIKMRFNIREQWKIQEKNQEIYNKIRNVLIEEVFETLIRKGVLTKFVPNPRLSNLEITKRDDLHDKQRIFSMTDDNKYWVHAYHYLLNIPYKLIPTYTESKDGSKQHYFVMQYENKSAPWYTFDSYNWVIQIGFCHRFINNRVIFITGATGVGKSTEVPKLFLYYSKAIDYISAPKIVCSQPRITPVKKNAERVAKTLGIPIVYYDPTQTHDKVEDDEDEDKEQPKDQQKDQSNYYYIQSSYRGKDKHVKRVNHAMLKYITDGTLMLELKDTFLKLRTKDNKFKPWNIYDIIMIDEAHEHKQNMDLLLTVLKYAINNNNSLRLVILSATMDDDEPRYRRFYRDINDNRKFPLNDMIRQNKLDRINIDRRYHIAIGESTNYFVKEIYEENKTPLNKIEEIIQSTSDGDILVFEPGKKDIEELIEQLKTVLPNNIIALPYYSELPDKKKKIVESLPKSLETINKTRAIIIATNIAEASITITSLRYVIDTGTQKVNIYDYKKKEASLVLKPISESSRIQRKGRVGRTASGTVYYLYKESQMKNNKILYEMAISDLSLTIMKYLKQDSHEPLLINNDPNNPRVRLEYGKLEEQFPNNLNKIIEKQYFEIDRYYNYFGNNESYDYKNYSINQNYFQTGFSADTLTDSEGTFYLIHPEELNLKRNINGDIVGSIEKSLKFTKIRQYKGKIKSRKVKSFWKTLECYLYIIVKDNMIIRSQIGIQINELGEKLQIENHGLFRMLVFGLGAKYTDIIKLYALYTTMERSIDITQLLMKVNNKYDLKLTSQLFEPVNSDSELVLQILNKFHEFMEKLKLIGYERYSLASELLDNPLYSQEDKLSIASGKFNEKVSKLFIENGEKTSQDRILEKLEENNKSDIENHTDEIINWCKTYNLDHEKLTEYLIQYNKINVQINKLSENTIFISKLSDSFDKLNINAKKHILEVILLLSFPFNVARNIDQSSYLSIYNPILTNTFQITPLSQYKNIPKTFMQYLPDYVLYLQVNTENDKISCLHKITPDIITILTHVYKKKHFNKLELDNKSIQEFITDKLKQHNIPSVDITNIVNNYTRTLNNIKDENSKYVDDIEMKKFIQSFFNFF